MRIFFSQFRWLKKLSSAFGINRVYLRLNNFANDEDYFETDVSEEHSVNGKTAFERWKNSKLFRISIEIIWNNRSLCNILELVSIKSLFSDWPDNRCSVEYSITKKKMVDEKGFSALIRWIFPIIIKLTLWLVECQIVLEMPELQPMSQIYFTILIYMFRMRQRYDSVVQESVGAFGWYQLRLMLVTQLPYLSITGSLMCTLYDNIIPPNYNCESLHQTQPINSSLAALFSNSTPADFHSLIMDLGLACKGK